MKAIANQFDAMMRTQFFSADAFEQNYMRRLQCLLRHAAEHTIAYRERLAPVFLPGGSIDPGRWSDIPILTREEGQESGPTFHARKTPREFGPSKYAATSGSTGRPFVHRSSAIMSVLNAAATARAMVWHGADFSRTLATITSADEAANVDDPGTGVLRQFDEWEPPQWRRRAQLSLKNPITVQLDWLDRVRPEFLWTYASNAAALASEGQGRPWTKAVRGIFCNAESLSPHQRSMIHAATGCKPCSLYGATETGLIAVDCPAGGGMHVVAEAIKVEVLDASGKPTPPGEIGEIVVTPLFNYAMPLIRYRLGDLARAATGPCGCGRHMPLIGEVLGRTRSMFVRPDGQRFWPDMDSAVPSRLVPYRQCQFVQLDRTTIEFRYVPVASDQAEDRDTLAAYVRDQLYPEANLAFTRVEEIERTAAGKYEDFRSLVYPYSQ